MCSLFHVASGNEDDGVQRGHNQTHSFEQVKLPAKLLDYFLWSEKGNSNQYSRHRQQAICE